jgi:hypothetical protein
MAAQRRALGEFHHWLAFWALLMGIMGAVAFMHVLISTTGPKSAPSPWDLFVLGCCFMQIVLSLNVAVDSWNVIYLHQP